MVVAVVVFVVAVVIINRWDRMKLTPLVVHDIIVML